MNLITARALLTVGRLDAGTLPRIAVEALEAGRDSPALRRLAGMNGAERDDLLKTFRFALSELGEPELTDEEARGFLARCIARQIVSRALSPHEGGRRIWSLWSDRQDLTELAGFVAHTSEMEDVQDSIIRAQCEQDIIEEARSLLRSSPEGDEGSRGDPSC